MTIKLNEQNTKNSWFMYRSLEYVTGYDLRGNTSYKYSKTIHLFLEKIFWMVGSWEIEVEVVLVWVWDEDWVIGHKTFLMLMVGCWGVELEADWVWIWDEDWVVGHKTFLMLMVLEELIFEIWSFKSNQMGWIGMMCLWKFK